MAAQNTGSVVKKAIQIDAGTSVRTVKSLKQEITDLRDELLNLDKGTKEYEDTQKQLQQDVEDLTTVMNAHKDQAKNLEGSYNDLQNQLKELKTAWKETNDEMERNELGEKIKAINDQLKEMDASIGDFHRNVGNYASSWEGLTGAMEKGEKISDDLEKGIKAFGTAVGLSDKQVSKLSKSLKAMKDGFKIAKDITKAKEESEKLATAEQQAAAGGTALATSQKAAGTAAKTMAASEGTATVATKGLSVAMRGLKAALISTGIGALIVALGSLISRLDEARLKLGLGRAEITPDNAFGEEGSEQVLKIWEQEEKDFERHLKILEAQGAAEEQILEERRKFYEDHEELAKQFLGRANRKLDEAEADLDKTKKVAKDIGMALGGPITEWLFGKGAGLIWSDEEVKQRSAAVSAYTESVADWTDKIADVNTEIEIFKLKQSQGTEELIKWTDAVKDPAFQRAWTSLFSMDFGGNNPTEIIRNQRDAALALLKEMKVDSTEVESLFNELIADSEDVFRSIQTMEEKIYEEGLTPVQKLEKERDDWVKLYEAWGQDTYNVVKYYNDKIKELLTETPEAAVETTEQFLSRVDAMLSSNEKLDALFNPFHMTNTAAGDIQQDIDHLQTLYDTQMEYLNGLLESADLTEEAYEGVEDRILELTVTFNNQMNALKAEQEYQGKNFAILTRKQITNWQLMEDAAADFSSVFQSLGLENSAAYKGFATAQALISALLAANRVLAEEPGEMIIKSVAAAATLAAGLANVAAIWAVNPDGSNANGMNPSMDIAATPVIGNSQPIQYSRNITTAEEEDRLNQPIWVSVVDLEDGLNGHKVRVENSSF